MLAATAGAWARPLQQQTPRRLFLHLSSASLLPSVRGCGVGRRRRAPPTHAAMPSPPSDLAADKAALRTSMRATLKAIPASVMEQESAAIAAHVLDSPLWAGAARVGAYVAAPRLREVATDAILRAALGGDGGVPPSPSDASTAAAKRLYVPVVDDRAAGMRLLHLDSMDSLVSVPPFGIREPRPAYADGSPREDALPAGLDVLLMPGVAFDPSTGARLGRGGGYYDAWAARAGCGGSGGGSGGRTRPPLLVALAFRAQVVPGVPAGDGDVAVDAVATADGLVACSERGLAALGC